MCHLIYKFEFVSTKKLHPNMEKLVRVLEFNFENLHGENTKLALTGNFEVWAFDSWPCVMIEGRNYN